MGAYQRKDAAYRRAKKQGLASRAAVKLEDLDRKFGLFKGGMRVLDLGCWPGGWLQIAARRVGPSGRVVGVDLKPVTNVSLGNVRTLEGDVGDTEVIDAATAELGAPADVVLCDMSPALTGVSLTDRARHVRLATAAIDAAVRCMAPQGKFLIKLFSGTESEITALLRGHFDTVVKFRPASTRKGSSELYALAHNR